MSNSWIIRIRLFLAGIIPFTLVGGWSEYGDHSIWPWVAGFGSQTAYVWIMHDQGLSLSCKPRQSAPTLTDADVGNPRVATHSRLVRESKW
jgi:hypothetical protein